MQSPPIVIPVILLKHAKWDRIKEQINKEHRVDIEKYTQSLIRDYESTGRYNLWGLARDFKERFYPDAHPGYHKAIMSLLSELANIEWPRQQRKQPAPPEKMVAHQWERAKLAVALLQRVIARSQLKQAERRYNKGDRVVVEPTAPALQATYPAANWLTQQTTVTLKEPAVSGTLDVVDVEAEGQTDPSIYGFNIVKKVAQAQYKVGDIVWTKLYRGGGHGNVDIAGRITSIESGGVALDFGGVSRPGVHSLDSITGMAKGVNPGETKKVTAGIVASVTLPQKRGDVSATPPMEQVMLGIGWGPPDIPDYDAMETDPVYHLFGELEDPQYGEGTEITKAQALAILAAPTFEALKKVVVPIRGEMDFGRSLADSGDAGSDEEGEELV